MLDVRRNGPWTITGRAWAACATRECPARRSGPYISVSEEENRDGGVGACGTAVVGFWCWARDSAGSGVVV